MPRRLFKTHLLEVVLRGIFNLPQFLQLFERGEAERRMKKKFYVSSKISSTSSQINFGTPSFTSTLPEMKTILFS